MISALCVCAGCGASAPAPGEQPAHEAAASVPSPEPPSVSEPPHEHTWSDGACTGCGELHIDHIWHTGICSVCGIEHFCAEHDADTLICPVCGRRFQHDYALSDFNCRYCGRHLQWETENLPGDILAGTDKHGTVETFPYTTKNYIDGSYSDISRQLYVYLPYGYYESDRQYNVMYMLPGGPCMAYVLFEDCKGGAFCKNYADIFDAMIANGYCEPFIAVGFDHPGQYEKQAIPEFINEVHPFVINNFRTYAAGAEYDEAVLARDHFAFTGYSSGAVTAVTAGLAELVDYISYFALMSVNNCIAFAADGLNDPVRCEQFPIRYCMVSTAAGDFQYWPTQNAYAELCNTLAFTDGVNLGCFYPLRYAHDDYSWQLGYYNALLILWDE